MIRRLYCANISGRLNQLALKKSFPKSDFHWNRTQITNRSEKPERLRDSLIDLKKRNREI